MESSNNKSVEFVNNLYEKLGYFDYYGTSVLFFMLITFFVFCVFSYCIIAQEKQKIIDDWTNQRCKPQNIPFAGWINKPADKTAFQYTGENFNYCVQNILVSITGYILQPFNYLISSLTSVFNELEEDVNASRGAMATLRDKVKIIFQNVFNRLLNVVIPIQKIFIALVDTLNKTQGILTSALFTMFGSYLSLQSLLGAILELIVKILVALAAVIVGLWAVPVTWPTAASLSAVFLAISIPMSIIVIFMSEVMHIKSSAIPSLRCFDKNVRIGLKNGRYLNICDVQVGDVLKNGDRVTATMRVSSKYIEMYILDGIIVSGTHYVKYNGNWIYVKNHPYAILMPGYEHTRPFIYCLNTTSKQIVINNMIFADWDELFGKELKDVINHVRNIPPFENTTKSDLHKYIDFGFYKKDIVECDNMCYKKISEVKIGDKTASNNMVYGIVHLLENKMTLLTTDGKICANGITYHDYNGTLDTLIKTMNENKPL